MAANADEQLMKREENSQDDKKGIVSKTPPKVKIADLNRIKSPEENQSKYPVTGSMINFGKAGENVGIRRTTIKDETKILGGISKSQIRNPFGQIPKISSRDINIFSKQKKQEARLTQDMGGNVEMKKSGALYYSPQKAMERRTMIPTKHPENIKPICENRRLELIKEGKSNTENINGTIISPPKNQPKIGNIYFKVDRSPPISFVVGSLYNYSLKKRRGCIFLAMSKSLASESFLNTFCSAENIGIILPLPEKKSKSPFGFWHPYRGHKWNKMQWKKGTASQIDSDVNCNENYNFPAFNNVERSIATGRKILTLPGLKNDDRVPRGELTDVRKRVSLPIKPDKISLLNDLIEGSTKLTDALQEIGTGAPYIVCAFKLIALECPDIADRAFSLAKLTFENAAFAANIMYFTSELGRMQITNFSRLQFDETAKPMYNCIRTVYSVSIFLSTHCKDLQEYYSDCLLKDNRPHLFNKSRSWTTVMQFASSCKKITEQVNNLDKAYFIFQRAHRRVKFYINDVDYDEIVALPHQSAKVAAPSRSQERRKRCSALSMFIRRISDVKKIFRRT